MPIYVLFFQRRGLSLAEFGVLEAAYTVILLAAEFPSGYVADRIGRRNSLLAAATLGAAGAGVYMLAGSFLAFLLGMSLRAVAAALSSGANDAWLYEVLDAADDEAPFARVKGRARALGLGSKAGAAVVGSLAYGLDPRLPWVLDVAALWLAAVALATVSRSMGEADVEERQTLRGAVGAARATLGRPDLRGFVAYTAVLLGTLSVAALFVQPVATDLVGIPATALGVVYAGLTLASAAGASLAGRVESTVGVRRWFAALPVAVAVVAVLTLGLPAAALALFALAKFGSGVSGPLTGAYVNDRTDSAFRASVLSGYQTVRAGVRVPLKLAAGAVAAGALAALLPALGVGVLVCCGILAVRWPGGGEAPSPGHGWGAPDDGRSRERSEK